MESQDPGMGWAAERDRIRAGDADRDRVIDALNAAFVQGRLDWGELARRTDQAAKSRTYADLTDAIAGIPPVRAIVQPSSLPTAPVRRRLVNRKVIALVLGLTIALPGLVAAFVATYYGSFFILLSLGFVAAAVIGTPSQRVIPRR